jgi:hypothetical protein
MTGRYDKLSIWRSKDNVVWYVYETERRQGISKVRITNGWRTKALMAGDLRKEYKHIGYSDCIPSFNLERV